MMLNIIIVIGKLRDHNGYSLSPQKTILKKLE